ncbi:MAG: PD40 domain-containing protein [Blastocatellia bacterium]|nr:PD40 domain-containing protein [Blastocatellia bacterium]
MNINYISKVNKNLRPVFSAICLLVFIFTATVFAQTPPLRANAKIAFTSDRDGNREIYVMNNDGTGQVRLTNNPGADNFPAFSPDGRRIAFVSQNASGAFAIKIMNADGTNQTEITPIAFDNSPFPWHQIKSLDWSADGSKIAFDEGGEIFTVNVNGSNRTNLTNHPSQDFAPSWSRDGSRIVFSSSRVASLTMHTMNADGSDVRALPSTGEFIDYSPDWSPTGTKIVFVVGSENFLPILYIANADGTNRQPFDGDGFGSSHRNKPNWSPDATKIIFHIWEYSSDDAEIYVKNVNGGAFIRLTNTNGNNFQPSWQPLAPATTFPDFDGDGRADISVFRPSDRTWYLNRSGQGFSATQFGLSADKITPADYDGDGRTDISVYRDGVWYWLKSSDNSFNARQFGIASDIPVPADYTGDGRAELAVYRGGVWWTLNLINEQANASQFGVSTDKPVPADYDGDGRIDQAVYRNGEWHLNRSSQGYTVVNFGLGTDKPVVGDYDGDGRADQAVYRDGTWYLLQSSQGSTTFPFGIATDIPAPADYDGDGKTDAAVYRNGAWYLRQSTSGISIQQFGLTDDKPVPTAYLP